MKTRIALLALAAALGSCQSHSVFVRVVPDDVSVQELTVASKNAKPTDDGRYRAGVQLSDGSTKEVTVDLVTEGGVEYSVQREVGGSATSEIEIDVPAQLQVDLMGGKAVELVLGTESVAEPELPGLFTRFVSEDGEELTVEVTGADGVKDRRTVTLRPGTLESIDLNLDFTARLAPVAESLPFGEEIEFDAGASTPRGSIVRYEWSFGDGGTDVTTEPKTTHAFAYAPEYGGQRAFEVRVRAVDRNNQRRTAIQTARLVLERVPLRARVELFPKNSELITVGVPVQFVIRPEAGFAPKDVTGVRFFPGDGNSVAIDDSGAPLSIVEDDGGVAPLVVDYTYTSPGEFAPRLEYGHGTLGLDGRFDAEPAGGVERIVVALDAPTDEELLETAWREAYQSFKAVLG
ncbi:MAG: PKD domain-containing protein, partial [Planctomycetota bacterium]